MLSVAARRLQQLEDMVYNGRAFGTLSEKEEDVVLGWVDRLWPQMSSREKEAVNKRSERLANLTAPIDLQLVDREVPAGSRQLPRIRRDGPLPTARGNNLNTDMKETIKQKLEATFAGMVITEELKAQIKQNLKELLNVHYSGVLPKRVIHVEQEGKAVSITLDLTPDEISRMQEYQRHRGEPIIAVYLCKSCQQAVASFANELGVCRECGAQEWVLLPENGIVATIVLDDGVNKKQVLNEYP